jgi:hypothetical protein
LPGNSHGALRLVDLSAQTRPFEWFAAVFSMQNINVAALECGIEVDGYPNCAADTEKRSNERRFGDGTQSVVDLYRQSWTTDLLAASTLSG